MNPLDDTTQIRIPRINGNLRNISSELFDFGGTFDVEPSKFEILPNNSRVIKVSRQKRSYLGI